MDNNIEQACKNNKESLIDFVYNNKYFEKHFEITEIVFKKLHGKKIKSDLYKIFDAAEKEKFVAKYNELSKIYEKNLNDLVCLACELAKKELDLGITHASKKELVSFVFECYSLDDHVANKKCFGPRSFYEQSEPVIVTDAPKTEDEFKEAIDRQNAPEFRRNARDLIFDFEEAKKNLEDKVASAKLNFETNRKRKSELTKKYAFCKETIGADLDYYIDDAVIRAYDKGREIKFCPGSCGIMREDNIFTCEYYDYEPGFGNFFRAYGSIDDKPKDDILKSLREIIAGQLELNGYFFKIKKIYLDLRDGLFKRRFGMTINEFDEKYGCEFSFYEAVFFDESKIEKYLKDNFIEHDISLIDMVKLIYISINKQMDIYREWKEIKFGFSVFDCPWYINIFFLLPPVYIVLACYISRGLKNNKKGKLIEEIKTRKEKKLKEFDLIKKLEENRLDSFYDSRKKEFGIFCFMGKLEKCCPDHYQELTGLIKEFENYLKDPETVSSLRDNNELSGLIEKLKECRPDHYCELPDLIKELKNYCLKHYVYVKDFKSELKDSLYSSEAAKFEKHMRDCDCKKGKKDLKNSEPEKALDRAKKLLSYEPEPQEKKESKSNNIIPKRENSDQKNLKEAKNELPR